MHKIKNQHQERTMKNVRFHLPYFQTNKLAYHNFMENGRRYKTHESETKAFISITFVSVPLVPQVLGW